jgi:RNA polymerase primary sigma factor
LLSSDEVKSEQIEDILAKFSEMGVNVVETETETETKRGVTISEEPEKESEAENKLVVVQQRSVPTTLGTKVPAERTDDPLRIYLRDMGSAELLSREGEIAIAKRIEAGREAMMAGLYESPLTFQAIIIWRDELNDGRAFLRDIIDLDATHAGPGAKPVPAAEISPEGDPILGPVPGQPGRPPQVPASSTRFEAAGELIDGRKPTSDEEISESDLDEDDIQNWLSVTAIEAELKPKVLETFDILPTLSSGSAACKSSTSRASSRTRRSPRRRSASRRSSRKIIITEVKSLRLNQSRIDTLVEHLYDINKRLVGHEGRANEFGRSKPRLCGNLDTQAGQGCFGAFSTVDFAGARFALPRYALNAQIATERGPSHIINRGA